MLFVGTSIIHPSTEGVFLLCNILDLLIYSYEKMVDKDSHKIKYFILGIILGFLVMFYGIISNNNVFIIGIGIIVMGMDVVLLPFTTPETINFLGYKKSKFAGRISGILLIVVGVWMWFIQ